MKRTERLQLDAIAKEAAVWGLAVETVRGGKHLQAIITGPRGWRKLSISGSPTNLDDVIGLVRQKTARIGREVGARGCG